MSKFEPISLARNDSDLKSSPVSDSYGGRNLYIDDPRVVELPECGTITFRFERGPVRVVEGDDGRPGTASVDLTLSEITGVVAEKSEDESEPKAAENAIDKLFAGLRSEGGETE